MERGHDDSSQWEQSKENIQPLKQGRRAMVLSTVLDDNATRKLNITRHEFEEELRVYSGDDPLDVWYRYILWVEQNYPKGGAEGKLPKLIEKCVMAVHSSQECREKYMNDQRFLDIWIKYASTSPNPLDIYQTMEAKDLCLSLANFYINWAWEMEKTGNYKRSDAIYEKGLQVGAQPLCNLQEAHKKFQIRVTRSTLEGKIVEQEVSSLEQERVALSSLKSQGRKIAVNRTGSAVTGPAGRCTQELTSKTNAGSTFSIFQDTSGKGLHTTSHDDRATLEVGASTNRENIKRPGQWTKSKAHRKTVNVVPVDEVDKYHTPNFSVHEDENAVQQSASQKTFSTTSSRVLSQHKEEYDDWHVPLFIAEPFDPKAVPQYCKHKVYCGTEEFSFEELRAAQFKKAEKKRKQEEKEQRELAEMREMLKKQEELIQKLLEKQTEENNASSSSKIAAPVSKSASSQISVPPQSTRKKTKSSHILYQDSWLAINKSVNASTNVSHLQNESGFALLQSEPPASLASIKESPLNIDPHPVASVNPCSSEPGYLSTSGNSRGSSFTDPAGNATNIVADMWCVSLSQSVSHYSGEKEALGSTSGENLAPCIYEDDCSKGQELGRKTATAFPIFSDPVDDKQKMELSEVPQSTWSLKEKSSSAEASVKLKATHVTGAGDVIEPLSKEAKDCPEIQDENCPPPGMTQPPHEARQISGILQPAKDIPVLQDQEIESIKSLDIEERNMEYKQANERDSLYISAMKNDDFTDVVPLDGKHLEDFTIKLPNNESVFSHMAKIASTPVPWSLGCRSGVPSLKSDCTLAIDGDNNFLQIQEEENNDSLHNNDNKEEMMPPMAASVITTSTASMPCYDPESGLYTIMEASRECRSSSSSSGCQTTSSTLPGHSAHSVSHAGPFSLSAVRGSRIRHPSIADDEFPNESAPLMQGGDFTKSGYLADKSKGETLADSLPHSAVAQQQPKNTQSSAPICSAAEAMMMELKDMMLSQGGNDESILPSVEVIPPSPEREDSDLSDIDPFDDKIINQILSNLEVPLNKRGGYVAIKGNMPFFKASTEIGLGKEIFYVCQIFGEGAYAKAYRAITMDSLNVTLMPCDDDDEDNEQQVILKVQKPACPWEFYICHELRQRLKSFAYPPAILNSFMKVDRGYFFSNGSVLANQYHKFGTILDVVNLYRSESQNVPEEVIMFFMVEIFTIMEAAHRCDIIHADIKPDNFLLQDIPTCDTSDIFAEAPTCLKLIDFGRSIDMKAFPKGTTFTTVVTTDKFTCCEMRDKKPWTYQTDYYGAAAIAHLLLFGTYMDVQKTSDGRWENIGVFKRYWKKELWRKLFSLLLNIPSCSALPSLSDLKKDVITTFYQGGMHNDINSKLSALAHMLKRK